PDPLARVDVVDAEASGGGGAEDDCGQLGGGAVEVAAGGHGRADRAHEIEAGGLDRQAVGLDAGDERAAVDGGAGGGGGGGRGGWFWRWRGPGGGGRWGRSLGGRRRGVRRFGRAGSGRWRR